MAIKTDIQLLAAAAVVTNETLAKANTASRVGTILSDLAENKINADKISTDIAADTGSGKLPTVLGVENFLKEDFVYTQKVLALSLNGVVDTTTAKCIYGINVISASTDLDFCCRLPLSPIKGRSVIIVNESTRAAKVFPSVTGGKINGVIDGGFNIPADGLPYTFVCYENPLPGYWSVVSRPTSLLVFPEMTIAHTQGVSIYRHGVGVAMSGVGLSLSYNSILQKYVVNLAPNSSPWKTEDSIKKIKILNVYTNALISDTGSTGRIDMWLTRAFQNAPNGATTNQAITIVYFQQPELSFPEGENGTFSVQNGVFNSPNEIGDINTVFGFCKGFDLDIGNNGPFGKYYYTFGMEISSACVTKDYKFRFEIEYI